MTAETPGGGGPTEAEPLISFLPAIREFVPATVEECYGDTCHACGDGECGGACPSALYIVRQVMEAFDSEDDRDWWADYFADEGKPIPAAAVQARAEVVTRVEALADEWQGMWDEGLALRDEEGCREPLKRMAYLNRAAARLRAAVADTNADVREQNMRLLKHEAETPMRGHDEDGECCALAGPNPRDGQDDTE